MFKACFAYADLEHTERFPSSIDKLGEAFARSYKAEQLDCMIS